ncbi:GAF domain-containing protein [Planctomycetota bacterium]
MILNAGPLKRGQEILGCVVTLTDITELKRARHRDTLSLEVLAILNRLEGADCVCPVVSAIKLHMGFEAVGIRLRHGDDFPYCEANGFPESFVEQENYLCERDAAGALVRDAQGNPVLECMCGNILCGRTDPQKPFFTAGGSFWSNCTTDLLATTTDEDRLARTRNRCNGEGYESVAVIPLRTGDGIVGLLQLNDHRRNQFTPEMIRFFENLCGGIGIAVARDQAHLEIKGLSTFPAENPSPVLRVATDGTLLFVNQAGADQLVDWHLQVGRGVPPVLLDVIRSAPSEEHVHTHDLVCGELEHAVSVAAFPAAGYANLYFFDITERRRAQEAIRASAERLQESQQMAHMGDWSWDAESGDVTWSDEVFRLFRLDPKEFTPQIDSFLSLSPWPKDLERGKELIQKAIESRQARTFVHRVLLPDDSTGYYFSTFQGIYGDGGELTAIKGTVQDVTDIKRAEEEIKLRSKIGSIFLTVPDNEMYVEVLKVVLEVAQSRFGVFGYIGDNGALVVPSLTRHIWVDCQVPDKDIVFPREEWGDSIWPTAIRQKKLLFSNSPSDLAPKGHVPITRNIAAPIVHQGEVVGLLQVANKETDYTPSDIGLLETLRDIVAPILSARLARDRQEKERRRREGEIVTLNKELDERVVARTVELTAVNKELEAFAYSVSHDLRAPLRGIDGFSRILLADYQDKLDDTARDYLNRVRAGAQRMGRLIDGLLKLSRLTRVEMQQQTVDLSELARKIADQLQRDEPERQVDFGIAAGITALGDRALLDAALENLLRNAWKFTGHREHARIELGVTAHNGERAYYVRDDGAGFDMAYADKLFGAFQRLHDTKEFPGTGIGLAIVQRVILRHGGRIWGEGEVDKGAAFYFTLPTPPPKSGEGV